MTSTPTPSIISYDPYGNARPLKVIASERDVQRRYLEDKKSHIDVSAKLNLVSYVVSAALFICQIVIAGSLCRPAIVLAGLWVAVLFLGQGYLGNRAIRLYTRTLLMSHTWLSVFVAVVGLVAAAYIFSGHIVIVCISAFHQSDNASVIRLYVVEVVSLVASVPCLIGAVSCIVSASLSYKAAQNHMHTTSPFIVCLQENSNWNPSIGGPSSGSFSGKPPDKGSGPPPSYRSVHEESFA